MRNNSNYCRPLLVLFCCQIKKLVGSPLRTRAHKNRIKLTLSRKDHKYFFKKWPTLVSFSFIIVLFKQTLQFLQQINVKKCSSSIWHQDSNSQPSDCESPPLTTRPGLPPRQDKVYLILSKKIRSWQVPKSKCD